MKIMKTQIMRIILSFFLVLTLSELSCNHPLEETTIISETVETTELLVPNSEMIHIIFSLNWILKNDVEPDPNTVKITFPISWVSDAPTVLDGDKPIELNVPKQLFDDHNESKDPSLVTAVFPNDYFKGLPVATKLPDVSPSPQLIISPPCMNFYTVPGGSPGSEVFLISAISGPLDWSLTKDATWLAISKKQGGATNEDEIITISVDTSGLGLGTYHTDIFLINESYGSIRKIPVNLFVTFVVSGEIPDIQILKEPSVFPLEGLILEQCSVAIDTMVKSGENPGHGYWYNTGDLCLVVRGKMRNTTEKDLTVGFRGVGYDENGNEVAWTLDASYLAGVANIDVPHQSTVDFKLTISWAENVKLIKVSAGQGMAPPSKLLGQVSLQRSVFAKTACCILGGSTSIQCLRILKNLL